MASRENMEKKLTLLAQRLSTIGYVPSQQEDRALYANVKYYYTHYPLHPMVKHLMELYPLKSRNRKSMSREDSIRYIQQELERRGAIPGPTEDRPLYSKIKYFYENYSSIPEVADLMARFPLTKKKKPSQFMGMTLDEKIDVMEEYLRKAQTFGFQSRMTSNLCRYYDKFASHPRIAKLRMLFPNYNVMGELMEMYDENIIEYFKHCYELYKEIPGERSIPMEELIKECRTARMRVGEQYVYNKNNSAIQLVSFLIESGVKSAVLKKIYDMIG